MKISKENNLSDILKKIDIDYSNKRIQAILNFYGVKIGDKVMAEFNIFDYGHPNKRIYSKDIIDEGIIIEEKGVIKIKSVNLYPKWIEGFRVHRPKYHLTEGYYYTDLIRIKNKI